MKRIFLYVFLSFVFFNLIAQNEVGSKVGKPQEPSPPFPYISEDVRFDNPTSGLKLGGTLTIPDRKGKYPIAILISGSGRQNRNEEILGHKPFLVLSDYLTRQGIAVFRYDDRGVGESEAGDLMNATTKDFAKDAEAAINYLKTRKEVDTNHIGLVGHSEGGTIAFMLAAENEDVDFIVSLAGAAIRGDSISMKQNEALAKSMGMTEAMWAIQAQTLNEMYSIAESDSDTAMIRQELFDLLSKNVPAQMKGSPEFNANLNKQISPLLLPWTRFFLSYDPAEDISKVKCPIFALNGSKDIQVDAKTNLSVIKEKAEANGNQSVITKEYPNLNHLFQHCVTGMPNEYESIEETINVQVLKDVSEWILKTVK